MPEVAGSDTDPHSPCSWSPLMVRGESMRRPSLAAVTAVADPRRQSSPCRLTTTGSWRRSALVPTPSSTVPSSSPPTAPSPSSASILIDSIVTSCRSKQS